jgi:hypothetical protein
VIQSVYTIESIYLFLVYINITIEIKIISSRYLFNFFFYLSYEEFHPYLFKKHELSSCYLEYDSFDKVNMISFITEVLKKKIILFTLNKKKNKMIFFS